VRRDGLSSFRHADIEKRRKYKNVKRIKPILALRGRALTIRDELDGHKENDRYPITEAAENRQSCAKASLYLERSGGIPEPISLGDEEVDPDRKRKDSAGTTTHSAVPRRVPVSTF
jgi:hypothetical protein